MTAMIFGGTRGIGKAVALRLLQKDYRVCILSRDEHIEKIVSQLRHDVITSLTRDKNERHSTNTKPAVIGLSCDVTSENQIEECVARTEDVLGPVNVLVNSAGISEDSLLARLSLDSLQRQLNVNFVGSALTRRSLVRRMLPRRDGCIINIGSIIGSHGNTGQSGYSASKSALIGFTKSMAKELAPKGIRVNLLEPGFIDTAMTSHLSERATVEHSIPLKRLGQPREVADAVFFLVNSSYITGQVLTIDGGLHLSF